MTLRHFLPILALSACTIAPVFAVTIDGRMEADEWASARRVSDFRLTQPLSREPAPASTQAWILATPEGLAIAFRAEQPVEFPRKRQRTERDDDGSVDRVNVYVDFDGDGRVGYNFTITLAGSISDATISDESRFKTDWDGDWQHASLEDDEGWSAEFLIPWHIATMRAADADTRTIGMSLDRVIASTGQRMSWPAIVYSEPRFLSAFERIGVAAYSQSLFVITPYAVAIHDQVHGRDHFDAGADLFWKPNGRFQLSATLNPDFAQVESDELEVNFSSVESFFSDRRPFFTENQSFFEVPFGSLNGRSRLIYTRRVGALADDGESAGGVDAAIKVNASASAYNLGLFAASESGAIGRDFVALRASRNFAQQALGAMVTRVDRPFLERTATVYEMDHRWNPAAAWSIVSTIVGTQIGSPGGDSNDSGFQLRADYDTGGTWRQQLYALHLGDRLQLNDFGYLERNNLNYLRYELGQRITNLAANSSYAAHNWKYAISRRVNDDGVFIADAAAISRDSQRRDGGSESFEFVGYTPGRDDRVTRGNGVVRIPGKLFAYYGREIPQPEGSRWSWQASARYAAEGLGGPRMGGLHLSVEPTYHVNDRLSHFVGLDLTHNPDWLIWRSDNLLGSYRQKLVQLSAGSAWLIDERQQLRIRLEAIGLDGAPRTPWRVTADGRPIRSEDELPAINVRSLGFQIRYRYELAPLSYLYVAYVRGGEDYDEFLVDHAADYGVSRAFRDAFGLRDSEQFLVKLSYRFD
ncbi:MAG: DUF5916 domain-containing protein [Dokdonella sp.]